MSKLLTNLRADHRLLTQHHHSPLKRLAVTLFSRGMQAVALYRLAQAARRSRIPAIPALLARLSQHLYTVDLNPRAEIGPGLVLVHCFGIVVGAGARIDGNCVIFHGVTLGDKGSEWVGTRQPDGHPHIGRGCILGSGAKILGPVRVGENCVIGANSVVIHDVPADSVAAGLPARVVNHRPKMDEHLRPIGGYRDDPAAPGAEIESRAMTQPE